MNSPKNTVAAGALIRTAVSVTVSPFRSCRAVPCVHRRSCLLMAGFGDQRWTTGGPSGRAWRTSESPFCSASGVPPGASGWRRRGSGWNSSTWCVLGLTLELVQPCVPSQVVAFSAAPESEQWLQLRLALLGVVVLFLLAVGVINDRSIFLPGTYNGNMRVIFCRFFGEGVAAATLEAKTNA